MTTSAVSMSVLEKYSSINRDIELARNQRALLESETEAVQEQMRELAEQRGTLETETVQANQEASVFHSRVDAAAAEYTRVEQEHTQAFLAKDRAVQEQTCLQQCVAETRQGFLEQSREFRSNCKRMRLRASSLGLDHASIRAFSIVNDMDGFIYDQLDHPPALAEEEDTEDGDPADWVAEDDDEEMQGFLLLYRQEQQAFEIATQHFEKCRARKETEMHKASSRKDRKDKLQAQVDKIQKVNSDLEAEIQEQESLAQEIKLMRDNYAKKASHRKLQITQHKSKVTPSPLSRSNQASSQSLRPSNTTRNPYARSSNSSKTATGSQLSSNSDTELQTAVLGRPAAATIVHSPAMSTAATNTTTPSLLERQHPHRTGRIRRDRQFGSTLEITGASRSWHETVDSFPEEIGADDTPTPQTSTSTFDQVVQALEDDDDDEDEALLSYTAFSK